MFFICFVTSGEQFLWPLIINHYLVTFGNLVDVKIYCFLFVTKWSHVTTWSKGQVALLVVTSYLYLQRNGPRLHGKKEIAFFICHVIYTDHKIKVSWLCGRGSLIIRQQANIFPSGGHVFVGYIDLIFHFSSWNYVIKHSCNFSFSKPLPKVTTL